MRIKGYNADNNYQGLIFTVGEFYLSQIQSLQSGRYEEGGTTYVVSAGSSGFSIETTHYDSDPSNVLDFLRTKGVSSSNVLNATNPVATFSGGNGQIRLSTYNAGLSTYYYTLLRNDTNYQCRIGSINKSNSKMNDNWNIFQCPIVVYVNESTYYFGCIGFQSEPSSIYKTTFSLTFSSSITNQTYLQPSASPGEKGFKPVSLVNDVDVLGGGTGVSGEIPSYSTDILTQPGAPDESKASVIGSGFLTVYDVTSANLEELGKCLFSSNVFGAIANIFINPVDYIISLNIFPYLPHIGSSTPIKFGMWSCTQASAGFDANGFPLTSQFRVIDFGTLSVNEMWHSFLDYDATSFELFLPFIGTVSLSINEVMGGTINVQYTIDFYTGMCVANVLCTRTVETGTEGQTETQYSQHAYQGNCAIQVPITQVGYSNLVGSIINAGIAGIKDPVTAIASLATDVIGGALKPNVSSKGSIVGNAGFCSVLYPYITIERPITSEPDSFQEVMGYPSYMTSNLGSCEGLCVCDNIDLKGISNATESELTRIISMCKEGVYV